MKRKRSFYRFKSRGSSKFAGLDPTYISGIERGLRNPGIKNVSKIAKALGITTSDLRTGWGEP